MFCPLPKISGFLTSSTGVREDGIFSSGRYGGSHAAGFLPLSSAGLNFAESSLSALTRCVRKISSTLPCVFEGLVGL